MGILIGGKTPESITIGGKAVSTIEINGEIVFQDNSNNS